MKNHLLNTKKSQDFLLFKERWSKIVVKTKFSQLIDNRFHFHDGIVSLPFRHKNLKQIDDFKRKKGQKIEKYFWKEKEILFNMEKPIKKYPKTLLVRSDPDVCQILKFLI